MNGFLLDTNVPSELTKPRSEARVEAWLHATNDEQLFLSVVTFGEILKGITLLPDGRKREQIQHWLDYTLRPWFEGRILPITQVIAERWGVLTGQRQLQGKPINVSDGLIAATALEHSLIVVTRNVRDFQDIGLRTFNPWD